MLGVKPQHSLGGRGAGWVGGRSGGEIAPLYIFPKGSIVSAYCGFTPPEARGGVAHFALTLVISDTLLYLSTLVIRLGFETQLIYRFVPVLQRAAEAEIRLAAVSCV